MRLTLTHVIAALGKRVRLPIGVAESLLARPASVATTGEALSKIDTAVAELMSSSVTVAEKKWEELVGSLRAQLETMQGGESDYKDKLKDLDQQVGCSQSDLSIARHVYQSEGCAARRSRSCLLSATR